jgi:hypothetical protein
MERLAFQEIAHIAKQPANDYEIIWRVINASFMRRGQG